MVITALAIAVAVISNSGVNVNVSVAGLGVKVAVNVFGAFVNEGMIVSVALREVAEGLQAVISNINATVGGNICFLIDLLQLSAQLGGKRTGLLGWPAGLVGTPTS